MSESEWLGKRKLRACGDATHRRTKQMRNNFFVRDQVRNRDDGEREGESMVCGEQTSPSQP